MNEWTKMKQKVLALAIKRMIWAEMALTATLAAPAFAQSQPSPGGGRDCDGGRAGCACADR
ncbi:TonB-dependent receptor [Burkholderia cepacia]|nr:hypothetical protein DM41_7480 [Burkholderia cepacia ATCC 25416]SPU90035.1 TonB-dependent receptor [Burkholderia cepacia]